VPTYPWITSNARQSTRRTRHVLRAIYRSPEAIESPEWHKDFLDERQQRIADRSAQFGDWETAKAKIREKLR